MGCNSSKTGVSTQSYEYTGDELPPSLKDSKSLLAKYLSTEVWNMLKDKKDNVGFSFRQAINSGVCNPNSNIGVYAGSESSYVAFAAMFDPVVEQYHGFKPTDKHVSDMDASKLHDLDNLDPQNEFIISTRIRVGRNLTEFPLGPAISNEQRKMLEKRVTEALVTLKGDLSGKYYALNNLTSSERKQLIADHFLFKEGDKYLAAVGLNRDWPHGRGIFHNTEKTFLVWVNEEDQLRIISMEKGADIRRVFERLSRACKDIEKMIQFAHNDHLGYITSCPTNLGTAMRASVHIKLPKMAKQFAKLEAIADQFHVQIRGSGGEHSSTEDGIFDISNKRRLGYRETDLIRDMYNGVKAMITAERAA